MVEATGKIYFYNTDFQELISKNIFIHDLSLDKLTESHQATQQLLTDSDRNHAGVKC